MRAATTMLGAGACPYVPTAHTTIALMTVMYAMTGARIGPSTCGNSHRETGTATSITSGTMPIAKGRDMPRKMNATTNATWPRRNAPRPPRNAAFVLRMSARSPTSERNSAARNARTGGAELPFAVCTPSQTKAREAAGLPTHSATFSEDLSARKHPAIPSVVTTQAIANGDNTESIWDLSRESAVLASDAGGRIDVASERSVVDTRRPWSMLQTA